MALVHNLVAETTSTAGSGATVALTAIPGFARFSQRFSVGQVVHYVIEDGNNREIGTGTVGAGNTLTRTTVEETVVGNTLTTSGAARIPLSGSAIVRVDATRSFLDTKLDAASYTAADVLAKVKTVDGAGSWLDADTVDGKHLVEIDGHWGQLLTHTAFAAGVDASVNGRWGWSFVTGSSGSPHTGSQAGYRIRGTLGNAYNDTVGNASGYAMDLLVPRNSAGGNGVGYLFMRQMETGAWGAWSKIKAGTADTLAVARTLTIGNYGQLFNGSANLTWTVDQIGAEVKQSMGEPRMNLGNPTVREAALFDGQFTNKTELYDITKFWVETSPDNVTWTEFTLTDTQKRTLLTGDALASSVIIPYGTAYFRLRFRATSYFYADALYSYLSTSGHTLKCHVYKKHDSGAWTQHTSSNTAVASWPGHFYLPFSSIPSTPSATLGTHYHEVAFVFIPVWNATYPANGITLYKAQVWGGYPAAKRNIFSTNELGEVTFPAKVSAPTLASTVSTGTAPLSVASTTAVANLNADLLDGQHGSYYTDIAGRLGYTPLNAASYTAADVLAKVKTVDGAGSGLDADTVDGMEPSTLASGNTIVQRDANGGIVVKGGYFGYTGAPSIEGGEIYLQKPGSGSTLSGDVIVDVNTNSVRIFDAGGTFKGAYVDLTACAAGAASQLWHSENDGSGSGLDADLLDGQQGSYYRDASNLNAGTVATARLGSGTGSSANFLRGDGTWNNYIDTALGVGVAPEASAVGHFRGVSSMVLMDSYASGANYTLRRTNGSYGSPTGLLSGDQIGVFAWRGHDGTAHTFARARIDAYASQTWTTSAHGTYLAFFTTTAGTTTPTEKARLNDAGLSIQGALDLSASTSGQVKFPATKNASSNANTLDDYKEQTTSYSPTITGSDSVPVTSATVHEATYTAIGNRVFGELDIELVNIGSATGNLRVTLPVTAAGSGHASGIRIDAGYTMVGGIIYGGYGFMDILGYDAAGMLANGRRVRLSFQYRI